MKTNPRAFTLIELLTVIAIIGILAGILIPVVSSVRVSARTARGLAQLRQIGMALELYANDNKFEYPCVAKDANTPWMRNPDFITYLPTRKSGSNEVADFEGSIFACPNAKSTGSSSAVRRSYSAAGSMYAASGGPNTTTTNKPRRQSEIRTPKTAPLVFDAVVNSSGICRDGTAWDKASLDIPNASLTGNLYIDYRQKGRAHFMFADYAVRGFTPTEVAAAFPDGATWSGLK